MPYFHISSNPYLTISGLQLPLADQLSIFGQLIGPILRAYDPSRPMHV